MGAKGQEKDTESLFNAAEIYLFIEFFHLQQNAIGNIVSPHWLSLAANAPHHLFVG